MTREPQPPPPLPNAAPPSSRQTPVADYASAHRLCPGCGGGPLHEPSFTWWGGLVGHKLLGVEQCKQCKKWWTKSTGQSGDARVAAYLVIGLLLGFAIGGAWVYYMVTM